MDIQELLQLIANSGMTDEEIAQVIGARQATVTRLRNRKHKSTSYERGKKIYELAVARGVAPDLRTK
jgi:transcriptional regulator with XRE-family HTH domain